MEDTRISPSTLHCILTHEYAYFCAHYKVMLIITIICATLILLPPTITPMHYQYIAFGILLLLTLIVWRPFLCRLKKIGWLRAHGTFRKALQDLNATLIADKYGYGNKSRLSL